MAFYYDPEKKMLVAEGLYAKALGGITSPIVMAALGPFFPTAVIAVAEALGMFTKPGSLEKNDTENIVGILEAGRQNGLSELELEFERSVAQGLNMSAVEATGLDITLGQKGSTRYNLKAKYK